MKENEGLIVAPATAELSDYSGADNDLRLIDIWLDLREMSPKTQQTYLAGTSSLLSFLGSRGKSLRSCTLDDLQEWKSKLEGSDSTRQTRLAAVKSLLSFGHKTGYLPFNVGAAIKSIKISSDITQRILSEEEVFKLFSSATVQTERLMRLLYYSAARISEACNLRWSDVRLEESGSATLSILGKGGKRRYVVLPEAQANRVLTDNPEDPDDFVLATRTGNSLHPSEATNMIRRAAVKAKLARWRDGEKNERGQTRQHGSVVGKAVSPHWFRHSHATHAILHNCPLPLLQATLGHSSLTTTGRYLHANPSESSGKYLAGI